VRVKASREGKERNRTRDVCIRSQRTALALLFLLAAVVPGVGLARAGEAGPAWQAQWEETVRAAEEEGQLALYTLDEVGQLFVNGGFQKRFPKIKLVWVSARGGELVARIMAERRAGRFLVDVGNLGNTSPYTLYQARALDPISSAFILPEVKDGSRWWQGRHHYIDPEGKYVLVFVGAPLYLVAYNTQLVNPKEFQSYSDLLDPKWKGKMAAFDPRSGGFAATRDRFFYHHRELGPQFLRRLHGEMELTLYRQYPQGENWLATGKVSLCLCRHQSISEARRQGLPVDLVDPSLFREGVGVESRAKTLVLINKAPHPNAAKLFINWFLSREGQIDFQQLSAQYLDGGAEGSLRVDIPKDDLPPRNRLVPGVKYIPQWLPEMFDMKPIRRVIDDALAEASRRRGL